LSFTQPGQSAQELNPYWQDGGSGLPGTHEHEEELHLPKKAVGDQGCGWLRKALQRVHEQAAETGLTAEAIAAERWGVSILSTYSIKTEVLLFKSILLRMITSNMYYFW
jgi:hypothetical protein